MRRPHYLALLLILALGILLSACSSGDSEPTVAVAPTEVPATEVPPTEVPPTPTAVPPTEVPPTEVPPTEVPPTPEPTPEPVEEAMPAVYEVVAEGFNAPQGILVDDEGLVWVIDSGVGGEEEVPFLNTQTMEAITAPFGESARVVRVETDGTQTVITQLPSILIGQESLGGARLALLDGELYATVGQGAGDPATENLPNFGGVVKIADGEVTMTASTWDFERAENPDGTLLYDSHPYGLTAGPDGMLYVADSGANDLVRVDPTTGEVTLVAVFDPMPGVFPNPLRGDEMLTDPVPTAVAFDEEGNALVSLLSGAPFIPGSSKVVQISADGEVSDYATGYTMLTDLRWGPDGNLYAVQIGMFSEQGPVPNAGAIVRIDGGDAFEVVAEALSNPTSIDFNDAGDAYVTINGGFAPPGTGAVIVIPGLAAPAE